MRRDSRLPRVLHALLHLGQAEGPLTSDTLAGMLGTDPAVVRRTMAGLREGGLVVSAKGHGGGWQLARPLGEITLLRVYEALGTPPLLALELPSASPTCLLERAANGAARVAMADAQAAFAARLATTTLADLARGAEAVA